MGTLSLNVNPRDSEETATAKDNFPRIKR